MANLAFLSALLRTNLKAALALRGAFVLQALFMALNNWIFFSFWFLLMRRVPHLRGWDLGDIAVLYGTVASGFGLAALLAGGVRRLATVIDEGQLDALLTQPKPLLLHALGSQCSVAGLGDIVSGLALVALSGKLTFLTLPLLLIAVLSSALMFAATGTLFFSLAFWLRGAHPVSAKLWETLITFALYPEPLFGGGVRVLLFTVFPAGFVGYVPAALVRAPSLATLLLALVMPAFYCWLSARVFERGLARYSSGSRIGGWD